ncbi:ferredoxin [Streptomyces sp. NPDC017529]|uniref:ferredoxin n=1 Tax=Streptomyces sp. NPDC017529 TaxID=3365000 RepID=UPI00378F6D42
MSGKGGNRGTGGEPAAGPRWRVTVDRGVCIGSGMCAATAPGGFELDAARQSHPRQAERDADEDVLAAAEGCPVEAIAITLADTGEAVFPPEE